MKIKNRYIIVFWILLLFTTITLYYLVPHYIDKKITEDKNYFLEDLKCFVELNCDSYASYNDLGITDSIRKGNNKYLLKIDQETSSWMVCHSLFNDKNEIVNYVLYPTKIVASDSIANDTSKLNNLYIGMYFDFITRNITSEITYWEICDRLRNMRSKYYHISEDSTSYINEYKERDLVYTQNNEDVVIYYDSLCRIERFFIEPIDVNSYNKETARIQLTFIVALIVELLVIIAIFLLSFFSEENENARMAVREKIKFISEYFGCFIMIVVIAAVIAFWSNIIQFSQYAISWLKENGKIITLVIVIGYVAIFLFANIYDKFREIVTQRKDKKRFFILKELYPEGIEAYLKEEKCNFSLDNCAEYKYHDIALKTDEFWKQKSDSEIKKKKIHSDCFELEKKYPNGFKMWKEQFSKSYDNAIEYRSIIEDLEKNYTAGNNISKILNSQYSLCRKIKVSLPFDSQIRCRIIRIPISYQKIVNTSHQSWKKNYEAIEKNELYCIPELYLFNQHEEETPFEAVKVLKDFNIDNGNPCYIINLNDIESPSIIKKSSINTFHIFYDAVCSKMNHIQRYNDSLDIEMESNVIVISNNISYDNKKDLLSEIVSKIIYKQPHVYSISLRSELKDVEIRVEKCSKYRKFIKEDKDEILSYLKNKGIDKFYHFTVVDNIESIVKNGGLYSWYHCRYNGIEIPCPGGGERSRYQDLIHGVHNYVHLSFCDDHPMKHKFQDKRTVVLEISIDVAIFENVLFSDINAADNDCHIGKRLDDLKKINFNAVKRHYVKREDPDFKQHQAEIMVPVFIPIEYIINLDHNGKFVF